MTVRKRKNRDNWEYIIELERDAQGKRRQLRRAGFKTKRLAELAEASERLRLTNGLPPTGESITFGRHLDEFLASHSVKPSTAQRYEELARLHVRPVIGSVQLEKLRPPDLMRCYQTARAKGLSEATVQRIHALIHVALEFAVKWDRIDRNPAARVDPPKPEAPETYTPTIEEVGTLLTAGDKTPLGRYFRFAALTGMRRGEILALRKEDVDFQRSSVVVRGNVRRLNKGRGMVRMTPKTPKSVRNLRLSPVAMRLLQEEIWAQMKQAETIPADYANPTGIIFANPLGGYRDPDHITRVFKGLATDAGLDRVRLHDLRHALATRMLERGIHTKVVQEILGHTSYQTTQNIYTHVTQGLVTDALGQVEALLHPVNGEPTVSQDEREP